MSGRVNDVLQTHTEISPHIHKVELPPKLNIWKEFQTSLKESFCLNEPSCTSKGRKGCTKFLFILQAIFLILEWGRSYNLTKFKGDLIAGLTIASLCVPQVKHFPTICNLHCWYHIFTIISNDAQICLSGYCIFKACKFGSSICIMWVSLFLSIKNLWFSTIYYTLFNK